MYGYIDYNRFHIEYYSYNFLCNISLQDKKRNNSISRTLPVTQCRIDNDPKLSKSCDCSKKTVNGIQKYNGRKQI